ncbi:hypothetical protein C8Q76DRAFT_793173 [Earliella scabrosa]|nr:hypothetical protein C8Q76DRAFT_793173 [Earliella scabrosa]
MDPTVQSAPHSDASRPDQPQHELFHRLQTLDDMIHASEEAEDKFRRITERRRIPPVPDLRFEYSYLRGVSQYVRLERVPAKVGEKGKEKAVAGDEGGEGAEVDLAVGAGEVVHVQWGRLLWITTRDQVISPLLQGALWGVASHFLRPFGALLGAHIRAWWARGGTRSGDAPEGNGVQWLRNRVGSVLTPTPATHSSFR